MSLALRSLCDDDIALVETWLNKEHVKRWYEIPHMGVTIADWLHEIREHNAERVTADIDENNKASQNALLSCGFTLLDKESGRYVCVRPKP